MTSLIEPLYLTMLIFAKGSSDLVGSLVWGMLDNSGLSLREKRKMMGMCVWSVFK